MAWSTPSSRDTDELITAAIWNQDAVDNVQYCYDELTKHLVLKTISADNLISNTTTETSLMSVTISGNDLDTNNFVHVVLFGDFHNATGVSRSITVRLKYGSTTLVTAISGASSSANTNTMKFDAIMKADNSDSAQQATAVQGIYTDGGTGSDWDGEQGTAAEDSTGDLTLDITAELSVASANLHFTTVGGYIKLYKV